MLTKRGGVDGITEWRRTRVWMVRAAGDNIRVSCHSLEQNQMSGYGWIRTEEALSMSSC